MEDKSCHIYTYDWEEIPWILNDDLNPTENKSDLVQLAVTNLIFALLLWDKQIIKGIYLKYKIKSENKIISISYSLVFVYNSQESAVLHW